MVFLTILGLIFKNNSARFCFSCDGSSVENTDRIKQLFLEEFLAGKKPTLKEFAKKYAKTIDVEEFLRWLQEEHENYRTMQNRFLYKSVTINNHGTKNSGRSSWRSFRNY